MSITPPVQSLTSLSVRTSPNGRDLPSDASAQTKTAFGVRVVDIAALKPDGATVIGQRRIPTLPKFDEAFAAFAQGTLFQSDNGVIAIEDLRPGDRLMTSEGTAEVVTWIGSATFAPSDQGERMRLTRIMADSFGVSRPENFISLGTAARLLQTPPKLRGMAGAQRMMTRAHAFEDGVNVIDVMPPTPVRLFHLALRQHSAVIAGGLEVESYHPGTQPLQSMSHTLRSVFMSLFPHIQQIGEFGAMGFARAPEEDNQTAA